jgi:hypothetical protein
MKFYNIFLIISVMTLTGYSFSQPNREGVDCPEDDCIENMTDMPPGPPDMEDHPGMMKERRMEKMSEEKIGKIMDNMLSKHPDFHKKLTGLKEKHPKIFMRTLNKLRKFVRNEKKGSDEKADILGIISEEIDIDLLVEKYQFEKDPKRREEIKAELLKMMSASFEKREEMKLEVMNKIQKNLDKKKAEFSKRKANKDTIVKEDLEKILRHHEKMNKEDKNK